jgi:uncharacterized protein YueI
MVLAMDQLFNPQGNHWSISHMIILEFVCLLDSLTLINLNLQGWLKYQPQINLYIQLAKKINSHYKIK